jgi:hypothetical protein
VIETNGNSLTQWNDWGDENRIEKSLREIYDLAVKGNYLDECVLYFNQRFLTKICCISVLYNFKTVRILDLQGNIIFKILRKEKVSNIQLLERITNKEFDEDTIVKVSETKLCKEHLYNYLNHNYDLAKRLIDIEATFQLTTLEEEIRGNIAKILDELEELLKINEEKHKDIPLWNLYNNTNNILKFIENDKQDSSND